MSICHHHSDHGQGLGLRTCSFEAQGVPGPSILLSVFHYPAILEVGTGRLASVGGFYPFVPGGLPISFDTVLCPPLCCPLSNCYGSQGFSGGPILWVLIVVSENKEREWLSITFFHHHDHHHWLDSLTWALAFLRSFCQLKYPAIASSYFVTRVFSRVGLSASRPTPGCPGGPMFSVRVVSLSWLLPVLKRQDLAFCLCVT
jgi:hypothetical protein